MHLSKETIVFNPTELVSIDTASSLRTGDQLLNQEQALEANTCDFKLPTITYHEVPLQFGLNVAHVATIDCGFSLPNAWNLVESVAKPSNTLSLNREDQTPPPIRHEAGQLQNSRTLQDQMIAIARAKAEASLHIRQDLTLGRCKNVDLTYDRVTYVNDTGKVVSGLYVIFIGTLE